MEALALKYRPRTFDDLVGQKAVQVILRRMVATNQIPTALLFDGSHGTGKTTTARILAAAANCETPPGPCGHCVSCKSVYAGSSLDVIEIDAASNGLADDMRQLCSQVMYRASGVYRIVILDEAHSASTQGFNVLLKTLEQPPPGTVFVLCTTEPGRVLDTVVSRCMPFTFRRISVLDIAARLTHIRDAEGFHTQPELLNLIAERADGALRDAINTLDQISRVGITTVEEFTDLLGERDHSPELLGHIAAGDLAHAYTTANDALSQASDPVAITSGLVTALKDVLILRNGGTISKLGQALAVRHALAEAIDSPTAVAAMRILWDLRIKARVTDDPRANLDLAIAMLTEVFNRHRKTTPDADAPPRRLSLSEMAARR